MKYLPIITLMLLIVLTACGGNEAKNTPTATFNGALFGTTSGALVITATPNLGYIGPETTPIIPQGVPITIVAGNTDGSGVAAGTTNCAQPQGWGTYTIVAGDTLGTIADSTGTTIDQLVSANCLTDASLIYEGQTLYVPGGTGQGGAIVVQPTNSQQQTIQQPVVQPTLYVPPTQSVPLPTAQPTQAVAVVVQPTQAVVVQPTQQIQAPLPTVAGEQVALAPNTTAGQTTASIGVETGSPLVFSLNGDLWSWAEGGALQQLTEWGYNERPVMSPDGTRVAYNSWATITVDAINAGVPVAGFTPSNIWVLDLTTGTANFISTQPANATFTGVETDVAVMRSTPEWSPDGTLLAWTEILLPTYARQLTIYDFNTQTTTVIVPTLPQPYVDAGNFAVADVRWGYTGLAISNSTYNPQSQAFEQSIYVYDRSGNTVTTALVSGSASSSVIDRQWVIYNSQEFLALLYDNGTWILFDPLTNNTQIPPTAPEMYNPNAGANSAAVTITAVDATVPGSPLAWAAIDSLRQQMATINFNGYPSQISISPTGQSVAYRSDALYVWSNGQVVRVPGTENLSQNRDAGGTQPGLVWGPTAWRVQQSRPTITTVANVPAAQSVAPATTVQTCTLPARLTAGSRGRNLPNTITVLRSAPEISTTSTILNQIPGDGVFNVLAGPSCADGYNWWQVNYNGTVGWTPEGEGPSTYWVEPADAATTTAACALAPRLAVGTTGSVALGSNNALRSAPSIAADSQIIGAIPAGATFTVLAGPTCANGYNWWQVNYAGMQGWTAEGENGDYWLNPGAAATTTTTPGFIVTPGATAASSQTNCSTAPAPHMTLSGGGVAVAPLALRSTPGTGAASQILGPVDEGATFTIIAGPQCGDDGRYWWQINMNGTTGWVAEGEGADYWINPG